MRKYLAHFWSEEIGAQTNDLAEEYDDVLFVNGRAYLAGDLLDKACAKKSVAFYDVTGLVAIRLSGERLRNVLSAAAEDPLKVSALLEKAAEERVVLDLKYTISQIWEIITTNAKLLKSRVNPEGRSLLPRDVKLIGPEERVLLLGDVEFESPVVLDTRAGPIVLGDNVTVGPFTVIRGPSWIGDRTTVFTARVEAVTVGAACKISGELKHTIMESYSNKAHEGYVGRSYVGRWVNIGAYAVTSDLKNTYGTVRVRVGTSRVDTGLQKLGTFIADYAKISVGTIIFAGKKIGTCSHAFDIVVEDVPPFTLYAPASLKRKVEVPPEKAISIQERVARRRGVKMRDSERELIRKTFEITARERYETGIKRAELPD